LRTRRGEVIKLPAFDEDPRTWQRQDGEDADHDDRGVEAR
jgi:hypothetical protein